MGNVPLGLAWLALLLTACGEDPLTTTTPIPSSEDRAAAAGWLDGGNWLDQHADICAIGLARPVEMVFLGDSITQSWGGRGRAVGAPGAPAWERYFAPRNAANFGISGDRTQHVLWRIDHGNFERIDPRAVVLLIGTNNLGHAAPFDVARGVEASSIAW